MSDESNVRAGQVVALLVAAAVSLFCTDRAVAQVGSHQLIDFACVTMKERLRVSIPRWNRRPGWPR
jgi:hypothetical protein